MWCIHGAEERHFIHGGGVVQRGENRWQFAPVGRERPQEGVVGDPDGHACPAKRLGQKTGAHRARHRHDVLILHQPD